MIPLVELASGFQNKSAELTGQGARPLKVDPVAMDALEFVTHVWAALGRRRCSSGS